MGKKKGKQVDFKGIEKKWQDWWQKENIYHQWNPKDKSKPVYSIDSPPPYPSGDFHMGNVLNYAYFDFAARYKRMRGFNVHYPQGWDVHGLPTEQKVEAATGKKCHEVERKKWREMCVDWTEKNIAAVKSDMLKYGFGEDWRFEYRTSDDNYMKMVQLSFLKLMEDDLAYRGKFPVNWCTSCQTAISDAEVEYEEGFTFLTTIKFYLSKDEFVEVATTRPELMSSCLFVNVNPNDARYKKLIGKEVEVPLFGLKVPVVADPRVDKEFGTGVMMVCSYGDKDDVAKILESKKKPIIAITEDGFMTEAAGKYKGLKVKEARSAVLDDLQGHGHVTDQKRIEHRAPVCWRCKNGIELLENDAWFVRVTSFKDKVIKATTQDVKWVPDFYKHRQVDWTRNLAWDWVISRKKVFGTPIPLWYCKKCNEIVSPDHDALPVDPFYEKAPASECSKCGGKEFRGEEETLDTWMDSSMTIEYHAGWPDAFDERLYPCTLQTNGADIIRTWDYYLMVRGLMLFGSAPYEDVLVNGIIQGSDGRKMSKSLGNYVKAADAREEFGADALRQWSAVAASVGTDVMYSDKLILHGLKFQNKLLNAVKFTAQHLEGFDASFKPKSFTPMDEWVLARLNQVVKESTEAWDGYKFNIGVDVVRNFFWNEVCDYYLEYVKPRVYEPDKHGEESKKAAQFVLHEVLSKVLKLLAPVIPHLTEELYKEYFEKFEKVKSIHLTSWPAVEENRIIERGVKRGEFALKLISGLRKYKHDRGLALNAELPRVEVIGKTEDSLLFARELTEDLRMTLKISALDVIEAKSAPKEAVEVTEDCFVVVDV